MLDPAEECPVEFQNALRNYAERHQNPGRFLRAVLANDLRGAYGQCPPQHRAHLGSVVSYVCWELPCNCHGSDQLVKEWISQ
jgi:hypothetical protein